MIARLVKSDGGTLDLAAAPYSLGSDFKPPAPNRSYNLSATTSASRFSGGKKVSETYNNTKLSFTVRILATGAAAVDGAIRRLTDYAENAVALEFLDLDLPTPLWGSFGVPLHYDIVTGSAVPTDTYNDSALRAAGQEIAVEFEFEPVATTARRRLASALGGVWEDTTLTRDRSSLGLRILEATTNKALNTVFGAATWNTGWTAGTSLIEKQALDNDYCFEGAYTSAFLTARASTNNTYAQSLNVGNTNPHSLSAIVARVDGAAVDANDCQIYYGAAQTSVFTALGYNGWYLMTADNIAGVAAGTTTGIVVKSGRAVYLIAYQVEEKSYHTPVCFGDMLGCAWTGTAHASTSTRAAGRVSLAVDSDTLSVGQWAMHLIWRPDYASTAAGSRYLFSCGATSLRGYFNGTDDKFYLTDNVNTISSAAQTFSAGDKLDLIFSGGPAGLAVYKNGASIASGATYTPPVTPTALYLGTDDSVGNHAGGMLLLADTYATSLLAADVTKIWASASSAITSGYNVGRIPWLWTKDGDDQVDNCNDSTHKNWAVAGGIPGSLPARTYYKISAGLVNAFFMGLHTDPLSKFVQPDKWWVERSGAADALCSAGNYKSVGTNTYDNAAITITGFTHLRGQFHFFASVRAEAGSTALIGTGFVSSGSSNYSPTSRTMLPVPASYTLSYIGALEAGDETVKVPGSYNMLISTQIETGAVGARVDFYTIVNGKVIRIDADTAATRPRSLSSPAYPNVVHLDSGAVYAESKDYVASARGDVLDLEPNQYNLLQVFNGFGSYDITVTTTFSLVYVTPRWSLI